MLRCLIVSVISAMRHIWLWCAFITAQIFVCNHLCTIMFSCPREALKILLLSFPFECRVWRSPRYGRGGIIWFHLLGFHVLLVFRSSKQTPRCRPPTNDGHPHRERATALVAGHPLALLMRRRRLKWWLPSAECDSENRDSGDVWFSSLGGNSL